MRNIQNIQRHSLIPSSLAYGRKKPKSKAKSKESKPREVEYLFIVTPDNGRKGAPQLPKRNSTLYTELENHGLIKSIKFTEDDNLHCIRQIQTTFNDIGLECWYFYRPDAATQKLQRCDKICMANCDFKTLSRCFDKALFKLKLILVLQVAIKQEIQLKKFISDQYILNPFLDDHQTLPTLPIQTSSSQCQTQIIYPKISNHLPHLLHNGKDMSDRYRHSVLQTNNEGLQQTIGQIKGRQLGIYYLPVNHLHRTLVQVQPQVPQHWSLSLEIQHLSLPPLGPQYLLAI